MRKYVSQNRYAGGIAYSEKEGIRSSYLFGRSIDHRTEPHKVTILPRTTKASGSVVTDLILDATSYKSDTVYLIGDTGNIYKRTPSTETWSLDHTAVNCVGNGIKYYGEDDFLYYTTNITIGRHGRLSGTPNYTDDFLGAEGGVPLNTASLDLESGSFQYATAADHASLSQTSDMTLEIYAKPESLPASGASMCLMSKWNVNGNERSYYFDLGAVASAFGDGGDGALTISSNTTQSPTDSACTGTAAAYTLAATNASFAAGDKILIHQTQQTSAGKWEENEIASYTAGTITLTDALTNSYTAGAQVVVFPEYSSITIDSSKTWTAKAFGGTVGGILLYKCSGTLTVNGTITAVGKGFRGGSSQATLSTGGKQGEGETSTSYNSVNTAANSTGGGGGIATAGPGNQGAGGGSGGHATAGTDNNSPTKGGTISADTTDLTTMCFGGGGGGGGAGSVSGSVGGSGGKGGGIIFSYAVTTTVNSGSSITATGGAAGAGTGDSGGGGSGGAGGSVLIKAQTATLGTTLVTAAGGALGAGGDAGWAGYDGAVGRIHCDYYTSVSGTTSPTLDSTQDDNLINNISYRLIFGVSSNGTNSETIVKNLSTDPVTAQWYRWAVKWDASASKCEFYVNGVSIGTATGSYTSCNDSTALFGIGARFDSAGNDENWFDGKVDDVRLWGDLRTGSQLVQFKDIELGGTEADLDAYWELDSSTSDSSTNSNSLTLVNSPVYDAADVPFPSPTTRQDIDQQNDVSGQTYTLATAIDEGATHRESFVPAKDPQKSIEVNINTIGTGDWTLTVHDPANRTIATATVTNGNLNTGDFEFVFSSAWTPLIGATYHFHLTSTVADGIIVTGTNVDLEDADFTSYYQFLISNSHHPIEQIINKLAIANGRYLATWDGAVYDPHALTLPSGFNIRCLAVWREYLVMGIVLGNSISDFDYGYLFFWNGTTDTYNFYVPISEGGINSLMSGDPLYFITGDEGQLMKYEGGKPKKVVRFPKIGVPSIEIYRKSMALWKSLVRVGFSGSSTSTDIERGVYTYGTLYEGIPETLSYDYPLSISIRKSADVEIGMVYPLGQDLLISWKNDTSYGVDLVNKTNSPYADATIELLIDDVNNKVWGEKVAHFLRAYFGKLNSGDTMKLKYKIDRNSSWTKGDEISTTDAIEARLQLPTKGNRFNEFQVAVDITTSNSTSPELYGISVEVDDLKEEKRM